MTATETAAIALLKDKLGATEIPPDYCRKCGRDYQPDGTCRRCNRSHHEEHGPLTADAAHSLR